MMLPTSYQELEKIYQGLSLKSSSCIAITSAEPGEGVSLIVDALAQRALSVQKRVLVVDLNLFHPRAVIESFKQEQARSKAGSDAVSWRAGQPPEPIQQAASDADLITAPFDKESLLKLREAGFLEQLIEHWKQSYDLILLDCSAVNLNNHSNIPIVRVTQAADGVLLCYLAGKTAGVKLKQACHDIQQQGALVLGVILNDQFNPALKQELLRSLPKMLRWLPGFSTWLCNRVKVSQLLSIRV